MWTEQEIRKRLKEFIGENKPTVLAKVKSVNKAECTCILDDDGTEYLDVRLRPVTGKNNGIVLYPKSGAFAFAVQIEESEEWMVLSATKYDSIEITIENLIINGGDFGGLIKINELTNKLNNLVNAFNSHTHQVSTTGTAAAQTGTAAAIIQKANSFSASDYENSKIKH